MVNVHIPKSESPMWECNVNNVVYSYPQDTDQTVPDEVASIIDSSERAIPKQDKTDPATWLVYKQGGWNTDDTGSGGGGGGECGCITAYYDYNAEPVEREFLGTYGSTITLTHYGTSDPVTVDDLVKSGYRIRVIADSLGDLQYGGKYFENGLIIFSPIWVAQAKTDSNAHMMYTSAEPALLQVMQVMWKDDEGVLFSYQD